MNYAFDQNLNEYSPHGYKNEQFLKKIEIDYRYPQQRRMARVRN